MSYYRLEKEIKLYKVQFDKHCRQLFGEYKLDRLSLDVDGILFRIKYMCNNNLDLDKLPKLENIFTSKAAELHKSFGEFLLYIITDIIGIDPPFKLDDVEDVLAQDVNIDTNYVKFTMILVSQNRDFLKHIDSIIPENKPFNIDPNSYFRFYTDSYNDGIAKAYPELFENKEQHQVGTGDDASVFCHNLTFQVTEACSLQCTYCMPAGTKITMANLSYKNIEDIKIGDKVLSINEFPNKENKYELKESTVTKLFKRKCNILYQIKHPLLRDPIYLTEEHPVLIKGRGWVPIKDVNESQDEIAITSIDPYQYYFNSQISTNDRFKIIEESNSNPLIYISDYMISFINFKSCTVYNFETTDHTYIAERMIVHNCYQLNKTPMRMKFETAKEFIDKLLNDEYGYINRYNSPAIIIEFIGGEPLLEIGLIRNIYEYFLKQCYKLNHPWFNLHRVSICSNGMEYFDPAVQEFFKLYHTNISFNISIDGNRELHDACRIQPNGEGSYDVDMSALNHYNNHYAKERNSKMTLAPSNIKYLYESVVDFINHGMTCININCVFEEGWTPKTAKVEYYELKKLADYIIDNNLEHLYIAIFNERQEDMMSKNNDGPSCGGGSASMLAIRPNGQFYPCIRYMPSSVGSDLKDYSIGSVQTGFIGREQNSEIIRILDNITRRSYSNDICYQCPLSNDCGGCAALSYQVYGTPDKRCTFICIQMIAEFLANRYYWNRLALKHPEYNLPVRKNVIPDEWSLMVIDKDELEMLDYLEISVMIQLMTKEFDKDDINKELKIQ